MLPREIRCGSGMTCWRRLRDWQHAGVWDLIHFALLDWLARDEQIDWSRAVVDSCSIRAVYGGDQSGPNPTDRANRGSKRHLICDGRGVPLAVRLTGANRNDSQEALVLVDAIPPLSGGRGRPRQRPDRVLGDRGYDAAAIRRGLKARHRAVAGHAPHRAWEWPGPVAVGRGAYLRLAQSVSPPAREV
jgi:transposase